MYVSVACIHASVVTSLGLGSIILEHLQFHLKSESGLCT